MFRGNHAAALLGQAGLQEQTRSMLQPPVTVLPDWVVIAAQTHMSSKESFKLLN